MKRIFLFFPLVWVGLLMSCSPSDYQNAIPRKCPAVLSVDVARASGVGCQSLLKAMLHVQQTDNMGLDLAQKLFFFESPKGQYGLCAAVDDASVLAERLAASGDGLTTYKDYQFTRLGDAWVAGFSDDALLVMGPVTVEGQPELMRDMAKWLGQSEEKGIKASRLYQRLDSLEAPVALVASLQSLPEKLAAPLAIGAPKGADLGQLYLAATMEARDACLHIEGETFSFQQEIDRKWQEGKRALRPIGTTYLNTLSTGNVASLFVNVDGEQFLPLLRANVGIQTMLASANAAIDMDNILKSVDGDMAILFPDYMSEETAISILAKLCHTHWMQDIGYWKRSVPQGGCLADAGDKAWMYRGGGLSFFFGVTPDSQLYSGKDRQQAEAQLHAAPYAALESLGIEGAHLALVIDLTRMDESSTEAVGKVLRPVLGKIKTIVYSMR
ncbi:MAG: DUF4836 family protein [Prevotella sp.]